VLPPVTGWSCAGRASALVPLGAASTDLATGAQSGRGRDHAYGDIAEPLSMTPWGRRDDGRQPPFSITTRGDPDPAAPPAAA
jgi:hypothetical protein